MILWMQMQTMPYNNLAGNKGVVQIIPPKWKQQKEFEFEFEFEEQVVGSKSNNNISTSSVESEPTSTLDTTTKRTTTTTTPSSPTSTSTFSSSFTGKNSGVVDPTCVPELHHSALSGSDSVAATGDAAGGGGGSGIGLEEWESMFPNGDGDGDGALLPWIMGEQEDAGLGLKHLLHSGAGIVEFDANADGLESLSPNAPPPHQPKVSQLQQSHGGVGSEGGFGSNGRMGGSINGLLGSIPGLGFGNHFDEKPQIFNPQLVMNQQQAHSMGNPSFLMAPTLGGFCQQLEQYQPQAKRHNPGVVMDPNLLQVGKNPFLDQEMLRKQQQMGLPPHLVAQHLQQKPIMVAKEGQNHHFPLQMHQQQQQLQEQAVKDQLFKAADLIQTGNFSLAQEILARLNHQLSLPAKPLLRAALYVKEALQMLLQLSNPVAAPPPKTLTPYDVVHKMNAYKVFSEVSPITQFMNFTCTQAILEALDDADAIHIIDFDIGCGAQWASLIQELPLRERGAPYLKITAMVSLSTTHPFELGLIRENLVQFANDTGVAFDLQVLNLDLFDPSSSSIPNFRTSEDESIAVSVPIWSCSTRPSILPSVLRFIKQCSPKVVVSLDRGFDRCDVPFPQHLVHTLESCTSFLESLDGVNVTSDIVSKVEKFFIQPRIENTVLGRVHAPDKMPHWKNLFASAGLMPLQFSNFTETQADYVVKRTPGRGFHVEKRQASLYLSWQRRELVAASAWRC